MENAVAGNDVVENAAENAVVEKIDLEAHSFCPVHNAINILQEKWTMHIIRGLLSGTKGFNELRRITGGVNAATLTQRLEHLERIGLLTKTVHSTMPPRTAYALTEAGVGLQKVVDAVAYWANRYLPNAQKPPSSEVVFEEASQKVSTEVCEEI